MKNIIDKVPKEVFFALKTLNDGGYEAYIIGGSVRDIVMGNTPYDFDIATNALPSEVKPMFSKVFSTGEKHGTVTVVLGSYNIEVTTYRFDGKYEDNRHPKCVSFSKSLKDDLSRRDFTINTIAIDRYGNITDLLGGAFDIQNGIIRSVGEASMRFSEDALRIMRAIRFATVLGFNIEDKTYDAIINSTHLLINISMERKMSEFEKILLCGNPNGLKLVLETGVYKYFFPKLGDSSFDTQKICSLPKNLAVRYAYLLHYLKDNGSSLSGLKRSNILKKTVKRLLEGLSISFEISTFGLCELISCVGEENIYDFLSLKKTVDDKFDKEECEKLLIEMKENGQALILKDLKVNGNDLIKIGITGIGIKTTLNELLLMVYKNNKLNVKNELIKLAKNINSIRSDEND